MKKILLIDDDSIYLKMTTYLFEKYGNDDVEIKSCSNPTNGIEALKGCKYDYIFLDINMPIMNGWEVLENIENCPSLDHIPTIYICSSSVDYDDIKKAKQHNMVQGYIEKPFRKEEITNLLEKNNLQTTL